MSEELRRKNERVAMAEDLRHRTTEWLHCQAYRIKVYEVRGEARVQIGHPKMGFEKYGRQYLAMGAAAEQCKMIIDLHRRHFKKVRGHDLPSDIADQVYFIAKGDHLKRNPNSSQK